MEAGAMGDDLTILLEQERLLRELGESAELAKVLALQSDGYREKGDTGTALTKLEEAESLFRATDNTFLEGKTLFDQVELPRDSGNPKLLEVLQRQETHYRSTGDDLELAYCLRDQAMASHEFGLYDQELVKWQAQIPLWEQLGDQERLAFCHGIVASGLCSLDRDPDMAVRCALESIRISKEIGNDTYVSQGEQTLALVFAKGPSAVPELLWLRAVQVTGCRDLKAFHDLLTSRLMGMLAKHNEEQKKDGEHFPAIGNVAQEEPVRQKRTFWSRIVGR
jgi:hypothetical protein